MNPQLLLQHFDRISEAPDAIPQLRRFILDLAVRGKLVDQDPHDEPASELLKRIQVEKARLVEKGKIKKQDSLPMDIEDSQPFFVPAGWRWERLANLSRKIHYGFTASANPVINEVRLLRITDIQDNFVDWNSVPGCEIAEEQVGQYKLESGDILIARTGGTVGKSFLVREIPVTAVFASYLIRVQISTILYDHFMKLFVESPTYWKQLEDGTRGAAQPNVNGQTLGRIAVPLPPLAEQHRIVAKVDQLMALCDQLEAAQTQRDERRERLVAVTLTELPSQVHTSTLRLRSGQAGSVRTGQAPQSEEGLNTSGHPELVEGHITNFFLNHLPRLTTRPAHIKQLRQTILNLAVRGLLVPQDPNDEPASELLKRIQEEKTRLVTEGVLKENLKIRAINDCQMPFHLPMNWKWVCFGELITGADAGWSPKSESFPRSGDNWGVLKVSAVSWGKFLPEENKQLLPGVVPPKAAQAHVGDFLISRANTSELIARCVVIEEEPQNLILSDKIVRLRITEKSNKEYLCIVNNNADYARSYYVEEASGTSLSMKNVSRAVIYALAIPLPPLAEQQRIVTKVDELMALCDQLETHLTTTATDSRRLLEAVLHEALSERI